MADAYEEPENDCQEAIKPFVLFISMILQRFTVGRKLVSLRRIFYGSLGLLSYLPLFSTPNSGVAPEYTRNIYGSVKYTLSGRTLGAVTFLSAECGGFEDVTVSFTRWMAEGNGWTKGQWWLQFSSTSLPAEGVGAPAMTQKERKMPTVTLKDRLGITELTDKKGGIWKALLAEFLGNLLLNFFGCGSCLNISDPTAPADLVRISLAFGLVIFGAVQAFCHVSGAHLNPAVTCGVLITGKIPIIKAIFYIIVQCLGAIAGSAVLKALTPDDPDLQGNLGLTLVNPKLSPVQGFGIEFFLGFVLVMVVFGVCDSNRNLVHIPAPLAIGLTVGMGHLTAVPLTGSSMNPARTFGSAVIADIWTDHWVYWLGPILGGMAAALIYQHAFTAPPLDEVTEYSPVRVEEKELKRMDGKDKDDLP